MQLCTRRNIIYFSWVVNETEQLAFFFPPPLTTINIFSSVSINDHTFTYIQYKMQRMLKDPHEGSNKQKFCNN